MILSRSVFFLTMLFCLVQCRSGSTSHSNCLDQFNREIEIGHFKYSMASKWIDLNSEINDSNKYLKVVLNLSSTKSQKSFLNAISKSNEDFESNYKYLSFGCNEDLYVKFKDKYFYPIGYVFEPSNGLSTQERLVYKFQVNINDYNQLIENCDAIEFWFVDHLAGSGKICFKIQ